ncbi:N-acetylmuramoyl-L-alanine amidase [bacterium]|nr:N-acetylmuramoyl-L-alanine amidase [bacterium]
MLKINSINFDNSDSIIFIGTSGADNLADIKITKKLLKEPDRVFFDIENAVITFPNSTYELKNSRLEKVKIAQNSVEPNIVRIVIWNSPNYDTSQIKILKIKNNFILKLSNEVPSQKYLTQVYRETNESAVEYYDKVTIIPETKPAVTKESDEIFDKVQQAFSEGNQQLVRPNIEQKQARLKSRFFLEKIGIKNENLLISGIGVVNIAKSFILTEPSRIVFDLPNTIVLQDLRDKEFKLSDTETVKVGQFSPSVARIVVKTPNPELFRAIYSSNLQTILIANENKLSDIKFSEYTSQLSYFKEQSVNQTTNVVNINFSNPVVYSIKREKAKIGVVFYNLTNFDYVSFNNVAQSQKTGMVAEKIGSNYKISFPVAANEFVDCYEALDASQLRFVFTKASGITVNEPPKPSIETIKKEQKKESPFADLLSVAKDKKQAKVSKKETKQDLTKYKKIKDKTIVIDAGHGGNDTGALRGKILEKDLTLQIALKVRDVLKSKGFTKVIMTRAEDKTLTLAERVEIANSNNADIYVSIHINASVKSEINGIETHYYSDSGYEVAKVMHKELLEKISAEDRGLFKSKFYVINHTEAPAVLLELGFISNEQEKNALISDKRQQDSAEAIAQGIINFLMEKSN